MIHIYKTDYVELIPETIYDIIEHEGKPLYKIIVTDVASENDDFYEDGWPVLFENTDDWAFYIGGFDSPNYSIVSKISINRTFYIRMPFNFKPTVGQHFVFLNQYDKRVQNEELKEALKNIIGGESDTLFTINQNNELEQVRNQNYNSQTSTSH